jgi:hypothetical protein
LADRVGREVMVKFEPEQTISSIERNNLLLRRDRSGLHPVRLTAS